MNPRPRPHDLEGLYPPEALWLPVNPALMAPRRSEPPPERQNTGRYRDYYGPNILAEIPLEGADERIAVIDKAWPHTLHDVMLRIAGSDQPRTGVSQTPDAVLAGLLDGGLAYVELLSDPQVTRAFGLDGGRLTIGWNHDDTLDRDNGQWWDKTMHWHLNVYPPVTTATVQPIRLGDVLDPVMRHSLVDPVAYLAQHVLADALTQQDIPRGCRLLPISPAYDAGAGLPVGLKIALPGWSFLTQNACRDLLRMLDLTADRVYRHLREAFTGSADSGPTWTRPRLLAPHDVHQRLQQQSWLRPATRRQVMHLRECLREVSESELAVLQSHPWWANRCLTLGGLSYNLTFLSSSPAGPGLRESDAVILVMQLKLFSAIGHTPAVGPAVASIIDRHHGPVMDESQLSSRRRFQDLYLAHLAEILARASSSEVTSS